MMQSNMLHCLSRAISPKISNTCQRFTVILIGMLGCFIGSCNRVDWVPLEDIIEPFEPARFSIEGEICTSPSEDLSYPLRVLFVVDASVSMNVSDPPDPETNESSRQRAVRETWERLLEESRGDQEVKIGIMRFNAGAVPLTEDDSDGDDSVPVGSLLVDLLWIVLDFVGCFHRKHYQFIYFTQRW